MNKESLKEYLSSRYQGWSSFLNNVIFPIFGEDDFEDGYEAELLDSQPERKQLAEATGIRSIKQVGMIYVDVEPLQIFDVTVKDRVMMERNRVNIQRLIRTVMDQFSCAFMLFHYEDDTRWDWRFTYCRKSGNKEESTDSKRYTFLLGPGQSCRTATDNFMALYDKRDSLEIKDIEDAFNVEALSKEFFEKYKVRYGRFVGHVIGKEYIDKGDGKGEWKEKEGLTPNELFYELYEDEKVVRDYVKKLLGRIVFLHFLQKKGWLGATDEEWTNGPQNFMHQLFENATADQKENFLDDILEPLFSCLDTPLNQRHEVFDTKVDGIRSVRVPFLGGLFERTEEDKALSIFPQELFADLFKFLNEYNFTIDENDPNDAQVGVDPEMLGRIFENLLEDNKDKGAFYTPKEIVQYMCRESLIAYLQTNVTDEPTREALRQFVTSHDVAVLGGRDSALSQNVSQCLKDVKICDPAIGSGAFPMGLLNELFLCRGVIEDFSNAANIKRHIIQNNIYGVDIERGAVDIARLRFWLSLIVDEKSPEALPNLDFKIMQGNSLLEKYKGADLSTMTENNPKSDHDITLFDSMLDVYRKDLRDKLSEYYACPEHDKKVQYRKNIADIVKQELSEQGIRIDFEDLDLSANSQFFLWHTWFHDVFSRPSKEGFDIVIGNPPYIQLQNNGGELAQMYEGCGYSTFARTGDIYCLFYERGWQLLKKDGHLCYITSNKWMRAGYGEKTREFFANKTNPMLLIDFAGVKIFESATVDTNILLFSKSNNQHETVCAVTNKQNKDSVKNLSDFVQQQNSICDFATSDSWVILSPIEQSIKKKIESVGTPLKDWDINIYRGVLTGCNEAFIIDSQKREEILANCQTEDEHQRTAELIRPILRGRDIKRYGYDWAELWLIATFPSRHYNIDDYPSVKEYLLSYGIERLEQTGETYIVNGEKVKARKKTSNKWFETQDSISYWEDFYKPKIVYMEIQTDNPEEGYPFPCYSFDSNKSVVMNTGYIMTSESFDVRYILGVLNSKLGKFITKMYVSQLQQRQYRMLAQFVIKFPIVKPCDDDVELISKMVQNRLNINDLHIESKINHKVYELYGLSDSEIDFIENFSR